MRPSSGTGASSAQAESLQERLREIWRIVYESVAAWLAHNSSSMGAALAFYTLFSVAPILIIALAVAGYFFGTHVAETELLAQLHDLTGSAGADALRGLLESAQFSDKKGMAAAAGVITLIIGATSVFGELQRALDVVWGSPGRPEAESAWWDVLRRRLLSFGMVLGVGFLLLVSLIASAILAALGAWLEERLTGIQIVLPVLDLAVSFGMSVLLFAMIYKYVPRETIAWRDVWVGAAVTAFLFAVGKSLIGLYLGRSSFSGAYGAAGSLIVLLLWIYYSAQIFLLGAEFTRAFAYGRGSRAPPPAGARAAAPGSQPTPGPQHAPRAQPPIENQRPQGVRNASAH
jgi:membrane protein